VRRLESEKMRGEKQKNPPKIPPTWRREGMKRRDLKEEGYVK